MADEHTCDECDETFDSADELDEHQQDVHDNEATEQADEQPDEAEAPEEPEQLDEAEDVTEPEDDTEPALDLDAAETAGGSPLDQTALEGNYTVLGAGFLIGVLLTVALFSSGIAAPVASTGAAELSEAAAQDKLSTYLADNRDAMQLPPGSDISVQQVEPVDGSNMHRATLMLTADVRNQTIEREFSAYLIGDGRYVFFGQAIDTTQPISEQIQQPQAQPQ